MKKNDKLSIIVYSCWKNRDMWYIFSRIFIRYWKNCPYKLILLTDLIESDISIRDYAFDDIIVIDNTWGRMIKKAIDVVATPYVMLFMDDYLLCDYVNNDDIEKQIGRIKEHKAINLRLIESPICEGIYRYDDSLGYYEPGKAYSLSTQVGIWDSATLYDIIDDEYSAWDFERLASIKCDRIDAPILVALDYVFPYEEGVRKGRWMEAGAKLCRRNGIDIDTNVRPIMSNWEMAKIYLKGAIIDINPTFVLKVQNLVDKIKKN